MKYVAFIILKIVGIVVASLPNFLFYYIACFIGRSLSLVGFRKKVLRENLTLAFPELTEEDRLEIEQKNYRHYGFTFLEMLHMFHNFDKFLQKRCDAEGKENISKALEPGKGAFVLTAHFGNWEVLTSYGAYVMNVPVTMVTKQLKPDWLHACIEHFRAKYNIFMAFEPKTMKQVLKTLKSNAFVGMAIDQYAGAPVGARVPFFGVPVGSHTALAVLALRTQAPVVPAYALRRDDGRLKIIFEPEIEIERSEAKNKDLDVIKNTAKFNSHVEKWVRSCPDQWLWIHRRWKGDLGPLKPNSAGELLK